MVLQVIHVRLYICIIYIYIIYYIYIIHIYILYIYILYIYILYIYICIYTYIYIYYMYIYMYIYIYIYIFYNIHILQYNYIFYNIHRLIVNAYIYICMYCVLLGFTGPAKRLWGRLGGQGFHFHLSVSTKPKGDGTVSWLNFKWSITKITFINPIYVYINIYYTYD